MNIFIYLQRMQDKKASHSHPIYTFTLSLTLSSNSIYTFLKVFSKEKQWKIWHSKAVLETYCKIVVLFTITPLPISYSMVKKFPVGCHSFSKSSKVGVVSWVK